MTRSLGDKHSLATSAQDRYSFIPRPPVGLYLLVQLLSSNTLGLLAPAWSSTRILTGTHSSHYTVLLRLVIGEALQMPMSIPFGKRYGNLLHVARRGSPPFGILRDAVLDACRMH